MDGSTVSLFYPPDAEHRSREPVESSITSVEKNSRPLLQGSQKVIRGLGQSTIEDCMARKACHICGVSWMCNIQNMRGIKRESVGGRSPTNIHQNKAGNKRGVAPHALTAYLRMGKWISFLCCFSVFRDASCCTFTTMSCGHMHHGIAYVPWSDVS